MSERHIIEVRRATDERHYYYHQTSLNARPGYVKVAQVMTDEGGITIRQKIQGAIRYITYPWASVVSWTHEKDGGP